MTSRNHSFCALPFPASQKAWLGSLLLFLATLVTASNAQCSFDKEQGTPKQPSKECVDTEGEKHAINSTWKKDCTECLCQEDLLTCCSIIQMPTSYDKKKCHKIFHPENCSYSVVERENPQKACIVRSWVM
ncbi:beta-microseminoprotein [Acomys russatus]|uniref:beta-microseminoprotein n=1 Tax=Acomys russatus TaxID=60746 RepID=UPI0021E2362E|nr:beta-microseminoprotein [Acomys russatus]